MTFKTAIIIGGLSVVSVAGPLAIGVASAEPVQPYNAPYNVRRNNNEPRISCARQLDALHHLNDAREALGNVLSDYPRSDSEYTKLAEAERQIVDGIATAHNRLARNHCPDNS